MMNMDEVYDRWPNSVDLGLEHEYNFVYGSAEGWPETFAELSRETESGKKEVVIGLMEWHFRPDSHHYCGGFIRFVRAHGDNSMPVWTVESLDPLTLSPSLLCKACKDHGHIQDGKWVPC